MMIILLMMMIVSAVVRMSVSASVMDGFSAVITSTTDFLLQVMMIMTSMTAVVGSATAIRRPLHFAQT